MPVPTLRALLLLALGLVLPLALGSGGWAVAALVTWDVALLALMVADAARAPGAARLRARRVLRLPLTAFNANEVSLELTSETARPLAVDLADAPPSGVDATGHRARLSVPPGGQVTLRYRITPRRRGRHAFGDLHLRVLGPLGLAWRRVLVPLRQVVSAYPDLRAGTTPRSGDRAEAGRARRHGWHEGREFSALRHYAAGDDVRAIDWKATARRASPVVREWQPERNQTLWLLLDCGRHLATRLPDGRTKLDRAVDAALALARAAAARGDRTGAILYDAEVVRVVPPEGGRARLGALAEALHLARARPVESDLAAAFDALLARQRRRALVVVFTDLSDPEATSLLAARAALLRRRHLVMVAAISDPVVTGAAGAWPADEAAAFERAAAERLLDEQEVAAARLSAAGVAVASVSSGGLAAEVVDRYLAVKARGAL